MNSEFSLTTSGVDTNLQFVLRNFSSDPTSFWGFLLFFFHYIHAALAWIFVWHVFRRLQASTPFGSSESLASSAVPESKAESRSLQEEHMVAALGK